MRSACLASVLAALAFAPPAFAQAIPGPPDAPAAPPGAPPTPPAPGQDPASPKVPEAAEPTAPPSGIAKPEEPKPAPPAVEPAKEPAHEPAQAPGKGTPRIHIEADRPGVKLLRIAGVVSDQAGEGIFVRTACDAPCDRIVDGRKNEVFFFGADGMVPSRGFLLSNVGGDVVANVDGGSFLGRQLGFLFGGFGGAAVLGGAIMLGVGYSADGATLNSEGKVIQGENKALTTGGFVTLGVGAALVATGITLVLLNKTEIKLVQATPKSAGVRLSMGRIVF
ncbi:hypothetical protein [Polyangium mundeleinium]|uniref:Uncharacterized protein n=1 Tax=Polyangium mundeleinium TaxID=2995306 RepID=A0ABT5EIV4_9BACT|nr:hypothetical protein [Polyangium mundeleinium]MDC0741740.1 hypothetical protein [Polyangium mundeleinium]